MFIYMGKVTGVLLPRPGSPFRRYSVFIPNVSKTFVEAFAVEQPGVNSLYMCDDTVAVADVEADDFDFLILGRIQLQVPDRRALTALVATQVEINGGKISNEVAIQNTAYASNSPQIGDTVIPKEVSVKSLQVDLHDVKQQLNSLSALLNPLRGSETP